MGRLLAIGRTLARIPGTRRLARTDAACCCDTSPCLNHYIRYESCPGSPCAPGSGDGDSIYVRCDTRLTFNGQDIAAAGTVGLLIIVDGRCYGVADDGQVFSPYLEPCASLLCGTRDPERCQFLETARVYYRPETWPASCPPLGTAPFRGYALPAGARVVEGEGSAFALVPIAQNAQGNVANCDESPCNQILYNLGTLCPDTTGCAGTPGPIRALRCDHYQQSAAANGACFAVRVPCASGGNRCVTYTPAGPWVPLEDIPPGYTPSTVPFGSGQFPHCCACSVGCSRNSAYPACIPGLPSQLLAGIVGTCSLCCEDEGGALGSSWTMRIQSGPPTGGKCGPANDETRTHTGSCSGTGATGIVCTDRLIITGPGGVVLDATGIDGFQGPCGGPFGQHPPGDVLNTNPPRHGECGPLDTDTYPYATAWDAVELSVLVAPDCRSFRVAWNGDTCDSVLFTGNQRTIVEFSARGTFVSSPGGRCPQCHSGLFVPGEGPNAAIGLGIAGGL